MKILICSLILVWGIIGQYIALQATRNPKLDKVREPSPNGTMNYFIAGLLNQPYGAFSFIDKVYAFRGDGMTYVPYSNFGVNMDATYRAIRDDIIANKYTKVRIFAISMGNMVTRNLEIMPIEGTEFYFYEINPCNSVNLVKSKFYWPLRIGTPIASVVEFALGPIGFIPFIETSGRFFSFRTLIDQLRAIAYYPPYPTNPDNAQIKRRAIVISRQDEFLDNSKVRDFYADHEAADSPEVVGDDYNIVEVDTRHADTIGSATEYFSAVYAQILAESGSQAP